MARSPHLLSGIILIALVMTIHIASAVDPGILQADLNVSKVVSSTGPYQINDNVTWAITLKNDGPGNATSITLKDDISQLHGLKNITAVADLGEYNTTTHVWSIDELKNSTSATLTIETGFSTAGKKTNRISITGLNETDPILNNNQDEAVVHINASDNGKKEEPISAKLVIRPTSLNLNSKGVFSVYVSLTGTGLKSADGTSRKPSIDYPNSSLTCGGADMVRASVSNRDGGTLVAKFHRADLENITSGGGVQVNCSGTLVVNGTMIPVQGSDTIRVIGEKRGLEYILSRFMKFFGLEKDDVEITQGEDGNVTVTLSLNPGDFKNPGQVKKMLNNKDNEPDTGAGKLTVVPDQTPGGKEDHAKDNAGNKQTRERNNNDKIEPGNKGSDKRDEMSSGKSNGKKNT